MFRKLAGLAAVAGLFVAGTAVAAGPDRMAGSAHDFSGDLWSGGEICVVCHTTHNGEIVSGAPLWNHELTSGNTYQLYGGVDMQAAPADPQANAAGEGISTLCLSCHDGTVALDSFGGNTGGTLISAVGTPVGYAEVGIDLRDDHPIAIAYNSGLQTDMEDPSSATTDLGGTINADLLFGGNVECASCHDVHNGGATTKLLVFSNDGSALCQTCHLK
jgi:predicted CXXCH cytochrome family protein